MGRFGIVDNNGTRWNRVCHSKISGLRGEIVSRVVDFFIVGAMRSGTSSIRDALARHPEVEMAHGEPKFFSDDGKYADGFADYHQNFDWSSGKTVFGEKSPTYAISDAAPKRVFNYNRDARIIWMLRDPVDRAISHFSHSRFRTKEAIPLDVAIRERETLERTRNTMAYVYRSQYEKQLPQWMEYFPRSQMHVLVLEEVFTEPSDNLRALCRFLGVEYDAQMSFPHTYKPQVRKVLEDNPVSEQTVKDLSKLLQPTVDWVEEFLGRDIPFWRTRSAS